jgi:ferredoxin--NADP+ reductase
VILKANETGERIPMTMVDSSPEKGTITIQFAVVGRSTILFSELQEGDCYQNVVGPLGRPTQLEKVGTAICIGGGTGVAVLYPIAKKSTIGKGSSILGAARGAHNLSREMTRYLSCRYARTMFFWRNALVTNC